MAQEGIDQIEKKRLVVVFVVSFEMTAFCFAYRYKDQSNLEQIPDEQSHFLLFEVAESNSSSRTTRREHYGAYITIQCSRVLERR